MIASSAWKGKRYAVLGLARSGAATVDALLSAGAKVVAWDADEARRSQFLSGTGPGNGLDPLHHAAHGPPPPEGEDLVVAGADDGRRDQVLPMPRMGRGTMRSMVEGPVPNSSTDFAAPLSLGGDDLVVADPLTIDLAGFAAVVVSPGIPLNRHPIGSHAAAAGVPVIGDIELFAQARAGLPPHRVVGITGTNGKSTTTALVHHILRAAGVPTTMGGNIGLPILAQEPLPTGGIYVLELSSYQIDLTRTLDCDVAVLLNVTPDHLDRYGDFEAYRDSKLRLFEMQSKPDGIAVIGDRMSPSTWADRQGRWPALQGPHNAQNAACAIAVTEALGLDASVIHRAMETFRGLPHRMERVAERDGVLFVNDSKATNAEAAAPALASFTGIRWILGGRAKAADLDACVPHFGNIRSAYTIGEAGGDFADLLRPHMAVNECGTLERAVAAARSDAEPGDTVLLSPAAASFDQFANFEARGRAFAELVERLP